MKLLKKSPLAVAVLSLSLGASAWAQNTEDDVLTSAPKAWTDTTTTFSVVPTTSSDVTFINSNYTNGPAFTENFNLSIGTLNDLNTSQTFTLTGSGTGNTITLNGGGDSVSGSNSSDLIYIASGATLSIQNGSGTKTLGVVLGASGNIDVAGTGTLTIGSIVSGAQVLNKTGSGTLNLTNASNSFSSLTVNSGTVELNTATSAGSGAIALGDSAGDSATLEATANNLTFANAINLATSSNYTGSAGALSIGGTSTSTTFTNGGSALNLNGDNLTLKAFDTGASSSLTMANGITGTGNLFLSDSGGTKTFTATITNGVNITGGITDVGTSTGGITLSAPVTVASVGTTVTNSSSGVFTLSGSVTGTGNLILNNNSSTGLTLSGATVNNTGTITNSGTGSGNALISGVIGTNITNILEQSPTSTLELSGSSAVTGVGTVNVAIGTLQLDSSYALGGAPGVNSTGVAGPTIVLGTAGSATLVGYTNTGKAGGAGGIAGTANPILLAAGATASGYTLSIGDVSTKTAEFATGVNLNGNNVTLFSSGTGGGLVFGSITGTGNVTLLDNGSGADSINFNYSGTTINNTGTITNTGTTVGASSQIVEAIGANVTGIIQNSAGTLEINNNAGNLYTGGVTVLAGTFLADGGTSVGVSSNVITLGGNGTAGVQTQTNVGNQINLALGASLLGTLSISSNPAANAATGYSGQINLNGNNLTISDASPGTGAFTLSSNLSNNTGSSHLTIQNNTTSTSAFNITTGGIGTTAGDQNITITNSGTSSQPVTISAVIGTGVTGVTQSSSNSKLILSGNNSYVGPTTVTAGTLQAGPGDATAFGVNNTLNVSGASGIADLNGNNIQVGNLDNGGASSGTILDSLASTTSTLTIGGNNADDGNGSYGGVIEDNAGSGGQVALTKIGTGTDTLAGVNTYTGGTTIAGGKLRVTGSIASGSTVTVGTSSGNTAILSGNGTVFGSVNTFAGTSIAYIAPGVNSSGARNDFGGVGTLTVGGNLTVGSGTTLEFDLSTSAGGSNDLISMSGGTLTFGGTTFVNINETGGTLDTANPYTLITGYTGPASGFNASNFTAAIVGSGAHYTAVFSDSSGSLLVQFTSAGPTTAGVYQLDVTATSLNLHAGGESTTLDTKIYNKGTGADDAINYTITSATAASGTFGTLSGDTSGSNLGQGANSAGATQSYTSGATAGNVVVTPNGSATNATIGGSANALAPVTATINVYSGTSTWNTNGSGNWGTLTGTGPDTFGLNWGANQGSPGVDTNYTSTDTATFDNTVLTVGSSATVHLNGATPSLNTINFNTTGGGGYTIDNSGGGNIFLNGGGGSATINDYNGTHTISAPITLTTSANVNVVNSGDQLTLSGIISGAGMGLTSTGAGTTLLSASNTYTGGLTVKSGTVELGLKSAATNGPAGPAADAITLGDIGGSNNASLLTDNTGAATMTIANPINVISGSSGILTLGGASSDTFASILSGQITINNNLTLSQALGGALQLSKGITSVGSGPETVTFAGPGTITLTTASTGILNGTNGATVGVVVNGGTAILNAAFNANTYTGGTTINAGTLQVGNFSGNDDGYLGSGGVTDNGSLVYARDSSTALTESNLITGTGMVTQSGTGTTIFTQANTYSGGTTISAGTLQVGNGGSTGSIGYSASNGIVDNSSVVYNRSDTALVENNVISGTGIVTQEGTGATTFTGNNTYQGGTYITGGTFFANNATSSVGTGPVTVQNGGTLSGLGAVQLGPGNGVTVQSGGNLAPGGVQPAVSPTAVANGNLTMDTTNNASGDTILSTVSPDLNTPALTFALGASGTSSQIVVTGPNNNVINFNNGTTVSINDLTGGNLTLGQEYILIAGTANTTYLGYTPGSSSSNGTLITGGLSLLSPTLTNSFSENYSASQLFVNGFDIDIVVESSAIPEPSTWGALMLGGLALLVVHQRRQKRKLDPVA